MRKMRLSVILFVMAVFAACAQQSGGDRQMSSGGYGMQSGGGSSESRSDMQYGGSVGQSWIDSEPGSQEQEYGGGAGMGTDTRSAHGFDRGSQTQTYGSAGRRSGPTSGLSSGEMGHGLGTQTGPYFGGSGLGGSGQ